MRDSLTPTPHNAHPTPRRNRHAKAIAQTPLPPPPPTDTIAFNAGITPHVSAQARIQRAHGASEKARPSTDSMGSPQVIVWRDV